MNQLAPPVFLVEQDKLRPNNGQCRTGQCTDGWTVCAQTPLTSSTSSVCCCSAFSAEVWWRGTVQQLQVAMFTVVA